MHVQCMAYWLQWDSWDVYIQDLDWPCVAQCRAQNYNLAHNSWVPRQNNASGLHIFSNLMALTYTKIRFKDKMHSKQMKIIIIIQVLGCTLFLCLYEMQKKQKWACPSLDTSFLFSVFFNTKLHQAETESLLQPVGVAGQQGSPAI